METRPNMYFWLMGDPFLRAFMAVYNMESKEVGLIDVSGPMFPSDDQFYQKAVKVESFSTKKSYEHIQS